jgi:hypothetical protein
VTRRSAASTCPPGRRSSSTWRRPTATRERSRTPTGSTSTDPMRPRTSRSARGTTTASARSSPGSKRGSSSRSYSIDSRRSPSPTTAAPTRSPTSASGAPAGSTSPGIVLVTDLRAPPQAAIDGHREIARRALARGRHLRRARHALDERMMDVPSNEFPHFIRELPFDHRGDPELGHAIARHATERGVRTRRSSGHARSVLTSQDDRRRSAQPPWRPHRSPPTGVRRIANTPIAGHARDSSCHRSVCSTPVRRRACSADRPFQPGDAVVAVNVGAAYPDFALAVFANIT